MPQGTAHVEGIYEIVVHNLNYFYPDFCMFWNLPIKFFKLTLVLHATGGILLLPRIRKSLLIPLCNDFNNRVLKQFFFYFCESLNNNVATLGLC